MNINDTLLRAYYDPKELEKELEEESLALYKVLTREEGIAEGKAEMVINMYRENAELNFISRVSNLTLAKVKEIINEYEK